MLKNAGYETCKDDKKSKSQAKKTQYTSNTTNAQFNGKAEAQKLNLKSGEKKYGDLFPGSNDRFISTSAKLYDHAQH